MAKISVPYLVAKKRSGIVRYYWMPGARLRKAGWNSLTLGTDAREAQRLAEAQNDKVEAWRNGGASPRAVKKFTRAGTLGQLIDRFDSERVKDLAANTQREYRSKLRIIRHWAGDEQLPHITRARVRKLRDALMKPDSEGNVHHNRAAGTLRVLRTLMAFAEDIEAIPAGSNPAVNPGLATPPPRQIVWSHEAKQAMIEAARRAGHASIALAIELAGELGIAQREADILALSRGAWREIHAHVIGRDLWESLAEVGPDKARSVYGFRIVQKKTNQQIWVPVVGETRREVERAVKRAQEALATVLLLEEGRALPWDQTRFQRRFAEIRDNAIEVARKAADTQLADELAIIQFRDLRRTAVVFLGELGIEDHLIAAITGHKLDTTRKILETYMPRTTRMAARAVVHRLERDDRNRAKEEPGDLAGEA